MRPAAKSYFIRVVTGVFGVIAALLALYIPFSLIANSMMEIESSKQYDGHISLPGAIGGSLLVAAITGFFGTGAYKLLRRAARHD
jgi:Ni/Fe-hydrogenase subunit HybB-like protein